MPKNLESRILAARIKRRKREQSFKNPHGNSRGTPMNKNTKSAEMNRQILAERVKTRKKEGNPYGTSLNGYTRNSPVPLDEYTLNHRRRTLRDRMALEKRRNKRSQKLKKKPLPENQIEEFLGMKPVENRAWNLGQDQYLRFQKTSRHSANNVRQSNARQSNATRNNEFYRRFVSNKGAPRNQSRYEPVEPTPKPARPKPVRYGSRKSAL